MKKAKNQMIMSTVPLELVSEIVSHSEAQEILIQTGRSGIYTRYALSAFQSMEKIPDNSHIKFHVPVIVGKKPSYIGSVLASMVNSMMRKAKINQRLRCVSTLGVLISEPYDWE